MTILPLVAFAVVVLVAWWVAGMISDGTTQKWARVMIVIFAVLWGLVHFGLLHG